MSRPSSPRRLADSALSYQWLTCQLTLQVLLDLTVATSSCLVMSEQQQQKRGGGVSVARSDICPSDGVSVRKRRPQFMSSDLQRQRARLLAWTEPLSDDCFPECRTTKLWLYFGGRASNEPWTFNRGLRGPGHGRFPQRWSGSSESRFDRRRCSSRPESTLDRAATWVRVDAHQIWITATAGIAECRSSAVKFVLTATIPDQCSELPRPGNKVCSGALLPGVWELTFRKVQSAFHDGPPAPGPLADPSV
ncbi:hypothetical protein AK812_SmicGene33 [Symbiodinium microadriaticum]|uniref:Uncharacterized protein n=1 Tax=Symbiodinium microadriaticum TaxID=2951 RepID=A0A1Q9F7J3_SYMMI|nr:hypothetical protein AK812_SmicGene33 [Symbiodinium microadriaticum]